MAKPTWLLVCCLYAGCLGFGGGKAANAPEPPTQEEFYVYENLSNSLTSDKYAMFLIRELFFPSVGESPVCVPITYSLDCTGSSPPFNYSNHSFDFLWTEYNSEAFVGQLLLSSAYYGVVLDGFDWVDYCWFFDESDVTVRLNLSVSTTPCNSDNPVLISQLQSFTALVGVNEMGACVGVQGNCLIRNLMCTLLIVILLVLLLPTFLKSNSSKVWIENKQLCPEKSENF